jgi:chromosome segregation ATPase
MRDTVTWLIIFVACGVVGILGYRYYRATEQIALLTEKTAELTAQLEGVTEVHKLTESKHAKKVRQAEESVASLTRNREQLAAEVQELQKDLAKIRRDRDALKSQVAALQNETQKLDGSLRALQGEKEKSDRQLAQREKEFESVQRTLREREAKQKEMEKARVADQEALRTWQGTGQRLLEEQKRLQAELRAREEDLKRLSLLQAERAAEVHELSEALKQREDSIALLRRRLQELEGGRRSGAASSPSGSSTGR